MKVTKIATINAPTTWFNEYRFMSPCRGIGGGVDLFIFFPNV
jgi:hypothetical protein